MEKISFELLMVKSLYSIIRAIEDTNPNTVRVLKPTLEELLVFECDFRRCKDFEDSH